MVDLSFEERVRGRETGNRKGLEAKGNHSGSQCSEVHRHTDGTVTAVPVMGACLNMEGESWGITNTRSHTWARVR